MFFAGPSQPSGQALESSTEALLVQTPVHTRHDSLDTSTQSVVLRAAAPASPGTCLDVWTLRPHHSPADSESACLFSRCPGDMQACRKFGRYCTRSF